MNRTPVAVAASAFLCTAFCGAYLQHLHHPPGPGSEDKAERYILARAAASVQASCAGIDLRVVTVSPVLGVVVAPTDTPLNGCLWEKLPIVSDATGWNRPGWTPAAWVPLQGGPPADPSQVLSQASRVAPESADTLGAHLANTMDLGRGGNQLAALQKSFEAPIDVRFIPVRGFMMIVAPEGSNVLTAFPLSSTIVEQPDGWHHPGWTPVSWADTPHLSLLRELEPKLVMLASAAFTP